MSDMTYPPRGRNFKAANEEKERKEKLAQLGAHYMRACGMDSPDELTPKVAERMLNLAQLGARVEDSLRTLKGKRPDEPDYDITAALISGLFTGWQSYARELGLLDAEDKR
jgi:hypothetical protein